MKFTDCWREAVATDNSITVAYGAATHLGVKYYQAYAARGIDRIESDIFEACDDVDVHVPRGEDPIDYQPAFAAASALRARMTDKQRSPEDMKTLARDLGHELPVHIQRRKALAQERFEKSQAIVMSLRTLEPLLFIKDYGTDEQKATFAKIVQVLVSSPTKK